MTRRKKRSLNRALPHDERDTNILFVAIEGGDAFSSREAKYLDIFNGVTRKIQINVIPCYQNHSSPLQVFNHIKERIREENLRKDDEIWVVIDVDRYHKHLPQVARECIDLNFNLAVSNPCFEFWLLLHYEDPEQEYAECRDVKPRYSELCQEDSAKADGYEAMFKPKVEHAIKRAQQRDNEADRWPQRNGSRVYRIVERFT